jgi:WD40 repeat protein
VYPCSTTASQDTTVRLWKVDDPRQPSLLSTLTGHTNIVYSVTFSPDGHTLATASGDNTARL